MDPTILLVDDALKNSSGMVNLLRRRLTAKILTAVDGGEGLQVALEQKPDLIVLDLQMPVLSGFEVLEQLKQRQLETRVIILSGYGDVATIVRCIRAGACDYLVKPVDTDKIAEHIKRNLLLETAFNLRIAQAPAIIQQFLDRADTLERDIRVEQTEQHRREGIDKYLSASINLAYVLAAVGAVWAMHLMGIVQSEGGVASFFLFLVLLLILPTGRIRDIALSVFGNKATVKIDTSTK